MTDNARGIGYMVLAAALLSGNAALSKWLAVGEVSVVSPYRYAGVLWAVGFGAVVFGELPDPMTFAGAGAIVASRLYVLAREREDRLRRVVDECR